MPFTKTGAAYTTPDVRLVLADAPWLADAAVSSWTVDRRLVASVIPGELRSIQPGLSVGAASVKVINTESRVTPWSPDPDRLVRTDFPAGRLEVVDGDDTLPLGSWVLNPVSGALSSREVDVDLLEAQYAGKQVPQQLEAGVVDGSRDLPPADPIFAVARMAEQAGFPAVPPMVPSALFALPLYGSPIPLGVDESWASVYSAVDIDGYSILDGDVAIGPTSPSRVDLTLGLTRPRNSPAVVLHRGASIFITLNCTGRVTLNSFWENWVLAVVNDPDTATYKFGARNSSANPTTLHSFTGQQSADWPTRVQIEMQRDWDEDNGQWTELRARIRSGPDAAWSSWVVDSTSQPPDTVPTVGELNIVAGLVTGSIGSFDPGQYAAVQVTTEADPDLWLPSKAHLQPIGGDMVIPWVPAGMSALKAIEAICSAWLAAAILGNDGVLRVLTKDDLAGVASGDPIVADVDLADLPWKSDPNDVHDRLEVTYTPALIRAEAWDFVEAWRADEVVEVPPNAALTIPVELDKRAAYGMMAQRLGVHDNPEGAGLSVIGLTTLETDQTSATTAVITCRNLSGATQYLVTDEGDPSLQLVAQLVATYETPALIARGKSAADAVNPLAIDLTPWVQREQDAESIANYLWGRLSGPVWKVQSVKCRLDWTLDIGQIRTLTHADSGLESKVLITRVHYDGKPGQIEQTLDLVLIPWTYADFAAAWEAEDTDATYADFATAQGPTRTYADMSADANWTGA